MPSNIEIKAKLLDKESTIRIAKEMSQTEGWFYEFINEREVGV